MRACTSVIMPVFNGAAFIKEAISSALPQLQDRDEIVVVDDGSTDNTRSVLRTIRDSRVKVLEGARRGVSAARNVGIAAARNELIAFLDCDDLWPQGRHKVMLAALIDDPSIDAVFGRIRIRFDQGVTPSPKYVAMDGQFNQDGSVCTGLFRRRIILRIGGFDERMRFAEDSDYQIRLREAGLKFGLCDIDSLIYRRHLTNSTNDGGRLRTDFSNCCTVRLCVRAREEGEYKSGSCRSCRMVAGA
jgi:glycosyltransferase involved in cell wall biosynthesis